MTTAPNTAESLHWSNSLIVRVVLLCVVLVGCLVASVYVLTVHFLGEVQHEVESEMLAMVNTAQISLPNPEDADKFESVLRELEQKFPGAHFSAEQPASQALPEDFTEQTHTKTEVTDDGGISLTAVHSFAAKGRVVNIVYESRLQPRSVILRALRNRYMVALTLAFLVTLGLMLYLIVKSLRPLRELSESCARISEGDLTPLEVRKNYGEVLALEQTFNKMVNALRDKEQLEANLRQAQRLSALGTLAAGIAHDVRNPLNAIKLLSSHALDTLDEQPDANGPANELRTIRKEVDRLEEIVSGFLALAKERELQPEPVKADLLLNECVRLISAEAEARGVSLTSEFGAGDLHLEIDPKQVKRAILNVIINAIEACGAGGRVRVFSRVCEDAYQIEVRDDGPGLTKEVAERAFDPYYTTKATGTGIGLSITRGIVEEHGGAISLSCTLGQGCQVLISLPLQRKVTK